MLHRKALAGAAAAMLVATGAAKAIAPSAAFTLEQPIYLQDEPVELTPLESVLDQAGVHGTLSENRIKVGGWIQAGWTYNFDTPDSGVNVGRVFDFEDQDPTLHQVVLFADRSVAYSADAFDIGGRIEWMWGGDARLIHANGVMDHNGVADGPDEQFDPTQFYVDMNLPVGNGLKVRAGKFVTTIGYETIDPNLNALYSRGFLFGYAIPFTHMGVLAFYPLTPELEVYGGIVRGWDQGFEDNNSAVSFMLGGGYALSDETAVKLNFIGGPEQADNSRDWRYLLDLIVTHQVSDELSLALNADFAYESEAPDGDSAIWWGIAGYATYTINENFAASTRLEYFDDSDGARGFDAALAGITVGVDIRPLPADQYGQGLRIRPEVRMDWSDEDIFNDGDDDMQFTFGVDAIYAF
jgi:hypothetical protein